MRAQQWAAQGQCEQALAALQETERADRTPTLEVTAAQCEIRLGRYVDAIARLESVDELTPGTPDAALFLGVARYHNGDLQGASRALERARGNTDDTAQLDLYTGMVLLQQAQTREAALALERARRADSARVEPVASYYALLAWQAEGERERAEDALARVQRADPGGQYAELASSVMQAGRPAADAAPREWWLRAETGIEYDTNVALVANNNEGLTGQASDESDLRSVWSLDGGLGVLRTEKWAASLLAGYAGSAHYGAFFDTNDANGLSTGLKASDFNTQSLFAGARVDRVIGESAFFRWQLDYTFWWVAGLDGHRDNQFLGRYQSTKYLTNDWGALGASQLTMQFFLDDYRFQVPDVAGTVGINESQSRDRDGPGIAFGLQHRVPLNVADASLTGGYNLTRKFSDGSEFDSLAHELFLAASMTLPFEVAFDVRGAITFQDFQRSSTLPETTDAVLAQRSDRDDEIYTASAGLTRGITRHLSASTRYYFTKADSNAKVFSYDRHIVGAYLTLNFP